MSRGLVDVVAERDVAVGCEYDVVETTDPGGRVVCCNRGDVGRQYGPEALELSTIHVALDVADLPVDASLSADAILEGKCIHLWVAPEPPHIELGSREPGAVPTRLLPGSDAG